MPLIDAAPDALARIYAQSLFDLAKSDAGGGGGGGGGGGQRVEQILSELEDILELAREDAKFGEFLASQILPAASRARSLQNIFANRVDRFTLNFLLVLNAKDRLGHLPPIVAAFEHLVQESFGRVEVDVYTAAPIDPGQVAEIRDRLRSILSREPVVHTYTDPTMVGGLRLQIGDQLIDASVSTRLRKMRDKLNTSATAEIRARAERLISE